MQIETEGYRILAMRFRLGFGLYIEHDENKPIMDPDSPSCTAYFDGLVIGLPFCELLIGLLWLPTKALPSEEVPPTK